METPKENVVVTASINDPYPDTLGTSLNTQNHQLPKL